MKIGTKKRGKWMLSLLSMAFFMVTLTGVQTKAAGIEMEFPRGQSVNVKVMSYNIHHAEGVDRVLDLERIAKVIEDEEADIIGLQEVDNHWSERSDFQDQAKWLANRLGMFYVYAANLDRDPLHEGEPRRQYGTAILSKYPILQSENHPLTKIGNTEQRGLLEATINVKGNHLHFYNTHLALTTAERQIQIKEIISIAGESEGPKVIMGDLNAVPDSIEMQPMYGHYLDVFYDKPEAYTYSAVNPTKRIDFIFTSAEIKTVEKEVIKTLASDHLPITAEIVLERTEPYENGGN
ncbi:endonuclease/exonuclease/phosphatase family protein [Neobacillus citreus]|uniref:Endonuclease/exonuclease/phosphatase family protein n=1 Tax=Neobacillus citreus TaxID=2833578 RepID=A0A9J6MW33_9BACI|nr:endonuclease/exonuclease/phosphatase family protein [Neobacillus citreus]MCH6267692.1 endonuclease/exonuclease/phosphatase family protein [Neobacillus citreus]